MVVVDTCRVEGCTNPPEKPAGVRPDDGMLCAEHESWFIVDPQEWPLVEETRHVDVE